MMIWWSGDLQQDQSDSLIHWFSDSLIIWFTESLIIWFSDSLIPWFTDYLIHWFSDYLILGFTYSRIVGFTESLILGFTYESAAAESELVHGLNGLISINLKSFPPSKLCLCLFKNAVLMCHNFKFENLINAFPACVF